MKGMRTIYRQYFRTITRKMDLIRETRSWLRTPFRDHCAMKAVGCDCVGFAHAVFVAVGAIEQLTFPDYTLDEGSHSNESKLERVLIDSGHFAEVWHRNGWPADMPPLMHGDLLGFHLGRSVHHIGIVVSPRHFIHAIQNYGVIESMIDDPTYRRVMVSVWRCMEQLERYDDFARERAPAKALATAGIRGQEVRP